MTKDLGYRYMYLINDIYFERLRESHINCCDHTQKLYVLRSACSVAACRPQLCQTSKTRQKLDWKIREIDGSYLRLQRFDKFWIWRARNDRKRKLFQYAETCMKISWNHFMKLTYFWRVLAVWNQGATAKRKKTTQAMPDDTHAKNKMLQSYTLLLGAKYSTS
jgi:hypothetical protein